MSSASAPSPPGMVEGQSIPREIWVMTAAAFSIAIGYGLIAPVLPQFAHSYSVTVTATTIVVSAFAACRLAFAPAAGGLVTRFAERRVYMAGVLIVAASSAATAFAQNYWQLLVFRGLGGIGSVMFTVAASGLVVRWAPPAMRGRVSALYASSFLIGNIAGPVIGGLLAGFGMQLPFLVYAGTLTVSAALIGLLLQDPSGVTPMPGGVEQLPLTVTEAVRDSAYRAVLATGFANGWSNFGIRVAMTPLFAAVMVSPEPWVAGAVLAVFALGNAVALTFSGRLSDTIGRRPLILVGLVVNAAFTAVIGLSTIIPVLMVVSALAGLGAGVLNPSQQAVVADIVGNDRSAGQVLATFQMVQDIGAISGPIVAGLLADSVGFPVAFALTGLVMLVSGIPTLLARETLRR